MISKQFKRSQSITLNWTNRLGDRDPSSHGWIDGNNDAAGDPNWVIDIQDTSDQFYSLPLDIIKGCSCRKKCTSCNCKKLEVRGKKCTAVSCRFCECYDRTEAENESPPSSSTDFSSTESEDQSQPMIDYQRDLLYSSDAEL